jgi:hypothetical protein
LASLQWQSLHRNTATAEVANKGATIQLLGGGEPNA